MARQIISSGSPFEEKAGYARAVVVGKHVYVSGCVGCDFVNNIFPKTAHEQAERAFSTIDTALHQAGSNLNEVVRVRCYVSKTQYFHEVLPVLKKHLGVAKPANTTVCAALISPECFVEIEVEAIIGSSAQGL